MSRIGQSRQMRTTEHYTAFLSSARREVVAPRATDMTSSSSTPPIYGIAASERPPHHHHPTQNIHDAWATPGHMSRSFSGTHTAHTPNTSQLSASSFAAHNYPTSQNSVEEVFFYRGQAVSRAQYSTSSPSILQYHLSPPDGGRQVNLAIPEMAGNAARPQHIYPYSPIAGPNNDIQVGVAIPVTPRNTMRPSNPYHSTDSLQSSFPQDSYHNANIVRSAQSHNHTQGNVDFVPVDNPAIRSHFPSLHSQPKQLQSGPTPLRGLLSQWQNSANFGPVGNPSMGSDFASSYSPPRQLSNNHTPHYDSRSQQQNPADFYPSPADPGFHSGPGQPWSFVAPEPHLGMSRGDHHPHPTVPTQPCQDLPPDGNHRQDTLHGHTSVSYTRTHAQPEEYLIPCRWRHDDNVPCKFRGSKGALKAHILDHLPGPQGADIICRWEGCNYSKRGQPTVNTMRRDSVWRHTFEMHLNVKFRKKEKVQDA